MKKIIVLLLILLTVFSVACQPQAKVVPTPDMVPPVTIQEAGAILYVNNTNLINQTPDFGNNSFEENNNS